MRKKSSKRNYRDSLDLVQSGFQACWRNAQDLVLASQKLIDSGLHAPALSLAVLALEELAKLLAIDGLLFARHDDHKAETFTKSARSHSLKLAILEVFPLLLLNLSRVDPRYGQDEEYNRSLAISLQLLKEDGNAVMAKLQEPGFLGLDRWKQQGFYVNASNQGFIEPREAVDASFAKAVLRLAWRATTTLDFALKSGNLDRYIDNARSLRAKTTEEQHQEFERLAKEQFASIFRGTGGEAQLMSHEPNPLTRKNDNS